MLNIEDCRRVFADQLQKTVEQKQSFERALMAACEFAYQRGLVDGAVETECSNSTEVKQNRGNP